MLRSASIPVGLLAAALAFATAAQSSDTCQRYTGGQCKPGQKMPPKFRAGVSTQQATQRPATSNHKGRDDYTPAQREKFMERARAVCRKNHGAPSRVYRVDFKRMEVWCEPPSY